MSAWLVARGNKNVVSGCVKNTITAWDSQETIFAADNEAVPEIKDLTGY